METCNPTQLNIHADLGGYFSIYRSGFVCLDAASRNKSYRKKEPTAIPRQRADSKHYCYCLFVKHACVVCSCFFFVFKPELRRLPRGASPYVCGDVLQLHHQSCTDIHPWPGSRMTSPRPEGTCCFVAQMNVFFFNRTLNINIAIFLSCVP